MKPDSPATSGGIIASQVTRISDLVSYQVGDVDSRELLKTPAGSVRIFAFDKGRGLSEHTAPFDALVQVIEGEVEISVAGEVHLMHGGELILLPARQPHAVNAITSFKMILTTIRSQN